MDVKYKAKSYWDTRYKDEDYFEWFGGLLAFQSLLLPRLLTNDRILILGCGNSNMSEDLYQCGYHNITNIDFSETVINKMATKTTHLKPMSWLVMDILDLKFPDKCFDVVIDKGTIDSLMVDQGSPWEPKEEVLLDARKALSETSRVLKPGGRFISITFSQPHFRGHMMANDQFDWSVTHDTFGDTFHYFFYVATKGQRLHVGQDYSYHHLYCMKPTWTLYFEDRDDEQFLFKIEI